MCDWVGCSLLEVTGEVQLRARDVRSAVDCFSLLPLPPKSYGRLQATPRIFRPDAVVICENDITCLPFDPPILAEKGYNRSVCFG
jgi:hypothetical protein